NSGPGDADSGNAYGQFEDGDAFGMGEDAGQGLSDGLSDSVQSALDEEAERLQEHLEGIPDEIEDLLEGDDNFNEVMWSLDTFLPRAQGCAPYEVPVNLPRYSFIINIDFCVLSRLKPLLEWIIWVITAVGVWKIFYAGLRFEDVKAAKGGF